MLHLRTILAPTDFSEQSNLAIRYAAGLARRFGAKLILLHVVADDALEGIAKAHVPPYPVDKVYEDLTQEVHEQFVTHVAREVRKGLEIEVVVAPGVAFLEIIHTARLREADLIVMATHGRTGLSHTLMGSVTEKVVRKAPCPVVSLRPVGVEAAACAA